MLDPLHQWLGIPPSEQPPHHYRLLGLSPFESDPNVIDAAADRLLSYLHGFCNGDHAADAESISNQISAARLLLLSRERKQQYDAQLRPRLQASSPQAEMATQSELAEVVSTPEIVAKLVPEEPSLAVPALSNPPQPILQQSNATKSTSEDSGKAVLPRRRRRNSPIKKAVLATVPALLILVCVIWGISQGKVQLRADRLKQLGFTDDLAEALASLGQSDSEDELGEVETLPPQGRSRLDDRQMRSPTVQAAQETRVDLPIVQRSTRRSDYLLPAGPTKEVTRDRSSTTDSSIIPESQARSSTVARPGVLQRVPNRMNVAEVKPEVKSKALPKVLPDEKPVDDDVPIESLRRARQLIESKYSGMIGDAKHPSDHLEVAKKLLGYARAWNEEKANRQAVYELAAKEFARSVEPLEMVRTFDEMESYFEDLDKHQLQSDAFLLIPPKSNYKAYQPYQYLNVGLGIVYEWMHRRQFAEANTVFRSFETVSRQSDPQYEDTLKAFAQALNQYQTLNRRFSFISVPDGTVQIDRADAGGPASSVEDSVRRALALWFYLNKKDDAVRQIAQATLGLEDRFLVSEEGRVYKYLILA
ncbi:MAG: hypothetical protein AAF664_16005, partial [Planctomycetota bacterium]